MLFKNEIKNKLITCAISFDKSNSKMFESKKKKKKIRVAELVQSQLEAST